MIKINEKTLKILFIIISLLLVFPSIMYLINYKTIFEFNTYYNFFIDKNINKIVSSILYLIFYISIVAIYIMLIKKENVFKDIKQLLIYITLVSIIFIIITASRMKEVYSNNKDKIPNMEIIKERRR